jgi:serine transporter
MNVKNTNLTPEQPELKNFDTELVKLNKESTRLALTFFGTAIGAGLLYLPVQAGAAGLLLSLIGMLIIYPITYYCQKYFVSMMTNVENHSSIAGAIGEYLGEGAKNFFNALWILMLLAGLISYGTGLVANLGEFIRKSNITSVELTGNFFFIVTVIGTLTVFALFSDKFIILFIEKATIALIAVIGLISILFIPFWDFNNLFNYDYSLYTIAKSSFLMAPILLFAVIYYCAMPSCVTYIKKEYKLIPLKKAEPMLHRATLKGSLLLGIFTALFVFSLGISLTPESLKYAQTHNLSALAVIARSYPDTSAVYLKILVYLGYAMTIIALVTTYYGVQLGLIEGLVFRLKFIHAGYRVKKNIAIIAVNFIYTLVIIFNFSVLKILGLIVIPSIALLIFVFPTIIIFKTPKLKKYRKISCIIVGIAGIFNIFSYFIGLCF